MADHSTTRDQLIEQAAQVLASLGADHLTADDYMTDAEELAAAGLLADPVDRVRLSLLLRAMARKLVAYRRWADGDVPTVHKLRAELDEMTGFAGQQSNARRVAEAQLAEERVASYKMYARVFKALGVSITAPWSGLADAARKVAAERDALQARIDAVRRWLDDPQDLTPAGQLHQIRAALQSDQHAELEPRCMNGPAKRDTLHMVGVIKALKSAAELDHLPLEPLRRDNFVRLARAIADHWPRDIDKPAAPFDLLETEEL